MLFILLPFLTGCWDALNLENLYYVNAIAVDYKEGQYEVYVQIVNFHAMASGAEGKGAGRGPVAYVGFARGDSFTKAIHNLYGHAQRRIYWGHTSSIIFTENILKHDIADITDVLRYHEFRHTIWFYGTKADPKELLSSFPIIELSVIQSYLGEPESRYKQSSYIEPVRMHRFYTEYHEPGRTFIFPFLDLSEYWYENNKPYTSIVLNGAGFIKNHKYLGMLNDSDINGLRWLNEHTVRSPLIIKKGDKNLATVVLEKPKVKIIPEMKGSEVKFHIKASYRVSVIGLDQIITSDELEKKVSQMVEKEIRYTFKKGLENGIDALNLLHSLYRKDPKTFKKLTKGGKNPINEQSLGNIDISIRKIRMEKDKLRPDTDMNVPRNIFFNKNKGD